MAIRLVVKDFENISYAKTSLDGLTAFVGDTNNGKTAMYNAVKVLAFNIAGSGYIQIGKEAEGSQIGLRFDDEDLEIMFKKAGSAGYILKKGGGKQEFHKIGRGDPPPEVVQALNMSPLDVEGTKLNLNFSDQMQPPLLKQMSNIQLYKTAVKSDDGERIQEAIKLCKDDIDQTQKESKEKNIELTVKKQDKLLVLEKLKLYAFLDDMREQYKEYEKAYVSLPKLKVFRDELDETEKELTVLDTRLKSLKELKKVQEKQVEVESASKVLTYLNTVKVEIDTLSVHEGRYDRVVTATKLLQDPGFMHRRKEAESAKTRRDKLYEFHEDLGTEVSKKEFLDEVLTVLKPLKEVRVKATKVLEAQKLVTKLREAQQKLEEQQDLKSGYEETLKGIEEELKHKRHVYDGNLCPTCNQKIKDMSENKEQLEQSIDETLQRIEKLEKERDKYKNKLDFVQEKMDDIKQKVKTAGYDPDKIEPEIKKNSEILQNFQKEVEPKLDQMEVELKKLENEEHVVNDDSGFDETKQKVEEKPEPQKGETEVKKTETKSSQTAEDDEFSFDDF